MIALRPDRDGRDHRLRRARRRSTARSAQWIIDEHLPPPGHAARSRSTRGYMANAWVRMKHPDYDELRRMLDVVGQTVKVIAS